MSKAINSASLFAQPTTELNANAIRFLDEKRLPRRLPTFRTVVTCSVFPSDRAPESAVKDGPEKSRRRINLSLDAECSQES